MAEKYSSRAVVQEKPTVHLSRCLFVNFGGRSASLPFFGVFFENVVHRPFFFIFVCLGCLPFLRRKSRFVFVEFVFIFSSKKFL